MPDNQELQDGQIVQDAYGISYKWDAAKENYIRWSTEYDKRLPGRPVKKILSKPEYKGKEGKKRHRQVRRAITGHTKRALDRRKAAMDKADAELKEREDALALQKEKLKEVSTEVEKKQELSTLLGPAPTNREIVSAVRELFHKKGFDPVNELVDIAMHDKDKMEMKDRIALLKTLAEFVVCKPKSMDINANVGGQIIVNAIDFTSVTESLLKKASPTKEEFIDADYDEFQD
jgi:hypothetical protein